jgi:asparagine synthase (glutamine-hydrolysing)
MVNLDGSPIDRKLLDRMTAFLAFRGPDAQATRADGPAGLGHALLRTTPESEREQQPGSLDGRVWITADARIDDRANLIDKLAGHGRVATPDVPDVELILHAYHAWGERCVEHLLGDFAFAIWDGPRRRLFCARDHFGVKPLYYATVGHCLVFSNTLNCLRLHPAVSPKLNEFAIGDFLLFGANQDPGTTAFVDVRRLPAARTLTLSAGMTHVERYWTLPADGMLRWKRARDYVARFEELLRVAVADRLRTRRVGVFMSGGLDSSAVAAAARDVLRRQSGPFELRAHTIVYDRLIPDEERYYSGVVAGALGIPIHYLVADGYGVSAAWDAGGGATPEPYDHPQALLMGDFFRQAGGRSRVALTGQGGDPVFKGSPSYFLDLVRGLELGQLMLDLSWFLFRGRRPPLGIRTHLRRWFGSRTERQVRRPPWLNGAFAARLRRARRWQKRPGRAAPFHPARREAYAELASPLWATFFEQYDPGTTQVPLEVRHPFFDVRLVRYLLSVPAVPWCHNKELMRAAMRGLVPEVVRRRPKTPLARDPAHILLCQATTLWDEFRPPPEAGEFVDKEVLRRVSAANNDDSGLSWMNARALSLSHWLRHAAPAAAKS